MPLELGDFLRFWDSKIQFIDNRGRKRVGSGRHVNVRGVESSNGLERIVVDEMRR